MSASDNCRIGLRDKTPEDKKAPRNDSCQGNHEFSYLRTDLMFDIFFCRQCLEIRFRHVGALPSLGDKDVEEIEVVDEESSSEHV